MERIKTYPRAGKFILSHELWTEILEGGKAMDGFLSFIKKGVLVTDIKTSWINREVVVAALFNEFDPLQEGETVPIYYLHFDKKGYSHVVRER